MRWTPNYHVACKLQDKILESIGITRKARGGRPQLLDVDKPMPMKPSDLSSLIKAWDTLEDRKRVLRMKPLPRAVDVSRDGKKAKVHSVVPTE